MCVCVGSTREREKKTLQQLLILSGKKNPEDKNVIDEFTVHDYSSVYEFMIVHMMAKYPTATTNIN